MVTGRPASGASFSPRSSASSNFAAVLRAPSNSSTVTALSRVLTALSRAMKCSTISAAGMSRAAIRAAISPADMSCNGNRRETGTATGLSMSDMVDLLSGRAGARRPAKVGPLPPACQFAPRAPLRPQRELPRKGAARIRGGIVPGRGGGWFGCTAPARRAWLDDIAGDRFDLGVVRAAQRHVLGHARHVHGPQPAPKQRPREPTGKPCHQAQEGKRRKAGNAVLTEAGGAHDAHALP